MNETRTDLEAEVRTLASELRSVRERLGRVEAALAIRGEGATFTPALASAPASVVAAPAEPPAPSPVPAIPEEAVPTGLAVHPDFVRSIPLFGRLLLVLAGAYLLRAVTEGGQVPASIGVAIGLAYAFFWMAATARAAQRGVRLSAGFHGVGAAVVAYPLIWETTTRFGVLSPALAALAVAGVTLPALAGAARLRLRAVSWTFLLGALAASALLLVRPGAALPFAVLFLVLGMVTLWLGRARDWILLPWAGALAADAGVFFLTSCALGERSEIPVPLVIVVQLGLVVLYIGSTLFASLKLRRPLSVFDWVQTAFVLLVGFRGALEMADATNTGRTALGVASLVAALAAYATAFWGISRERRRLFFYLATVALVLVLLGSWVVLDRPAIPWSLLAIATAWLGARSGRVTLAMHGAVYAFAAALASGLLHLTAYAWGGSAATVWPTFTLEAGLALAAALACAWLPVRLDNPYWREFAILPKLAAIGLAVGTATGVLIPVLAPWVAGTPGHGADAGLLAVLRTGFLAAATILCALAARTVNLKPAAWLVYPLLALGPVKLLLEDLAAGRPATLWISFLLYGAVLILAPRIAKGKAATAASPAGPAAAPPDDAATAAEVGRTPAPR